MFTETKTAGGAGGFELGAGYAIKAIPLGGGAVYPLTLVVDGQNGRTITLEDDGAIGFGPWEKLEARGLEVGAAWAIRMTQAPDEELGAAGAPPRLPALLWELVIDGSAGAVADGVQGTSAAELDVRRYRSVKLAVSSNGVDAYAAQTIKAYLVGYDTQTAGQGEELGAGTTNDFAPAAGYGYVAAGEGLTDAEGANARRVGVRFNYVTATLVFGGGPTTVTGILRAQLWGYP